MNNTHTNTLRELAKFCSGLVFADILVGIWVGAGQGYGSLFLGIPLTAPLINIWIILDIAMLLLLIHYGWQMELPPSASRKLVYIIIGCMLTIVALAHFLRIVYGVPLLIGGVSIPLWLSVIGAVGAGFLAYASFHFAGRK